MQQKFYTAEGATVQLGRELGRGGEGSVFEVMGRPQLVAKIYHEPLAEKKQRKLRFMAEASDASLLNYAAWPQDVLLAGKNGPVCGFLMARIARRQPVHMLYTPASRRDNFPDAAWDFLLFAARNTAAAFATLHSHRHVLGDVNQGNVMVGADSKVMLIDCDSFQIDANGVMHLCEVGVSHFTPPELQNLPSFEGVTRTANHDNFGLALLIFHLLFGGRHPYSGVPQRDDVGETLESNIKALRYAYARDAARRLLLPPPRSIPVSLVPAGMAAMFEAAFTEKGRAGERPTAQLWVNALDALRTRLKRCRREIAHLFPDHLHACPWCELDSKGIVYFSALMVGSLNSNGGVDLATLWAAIAAVPPPPPVVIPAVPSVAPPPSAYATPPPPALTVGQVFLIAGVVGTLILYILLPVHGGGRLLAGFASFGLLVSLISSLKESSTQHVQQGMHLQQPDLLRLQLYAQCEALSQRLRKEGGAEAFQAKKKALGDLKAEYEKLPQLERDEIAALGSDGEARQRQTFLETFRIDAAVVDGLDANKKALLRANGVETAADVKTNTLRHVLGHADPLMRALTDWKRQCERLFVYNPSLTASAADINAVKARIAQRRRQLAASLAKGPAELQKLRLDAQRRAQPLKQQLDELLRQLTALSTP